MNLQHYLDRIEYGETVEPSLGTLAGLHEAHVCSVPFENLDVQLGHPLTTHIEEAYEKIVFNSRGGWCYQQNGLFGWALSEIGFEVTRIAASVMRDHAGDASTASHLCLLVKLPETETKYLVDVGFGGSMVRPIPLIEGEYMQPPYKIGLEKLEDNHWRFWETSNGEIFSFDFLEEAACESTLSKKSAQLQSDPASNFVLNIVAQLRSHNRHCTLRGRVLTDIGPDTKNSITLESPEALVSVLSSEFRLVVPGVEHLWPKITARHNELFGTTPE